MNYDGRVFAENHLLKAVVEMLRPAGRRQEKPAM